MLGDPQQNGVAERHNRTLMDMVRSILSYSTLPISLWIEVLKTAIYGYLDKSMGFCFYCPDRYTKIDTPRL
jgi:hypothetical protein